MLRSFFQKGQGEGRHSGPRVSRHSSGWSALYKHLKSEPALKVLDIGPTSPTNINFLTGMGHGVWMADIVDEATRKDWEIPPAEEGAAPGFYTDAFFEHNLNFSGRVFDVIMLWTTLDYLPEALIAPFIDRLHQSLKPGGKVLALFHSKAIGPDTAFCRYHLTETDAIEAQEIGSYPIRRVYTNRNIEKLFSKFSNYKFFLAKDNVYEVIITR